MRRTHNEQPVNGRCAKTYSRCQRTSARLSGNQKANFRAADGGGERDRTDDLLLAKQALSQLSYTPEKRGGPG